MFVRAELLSFTKLRFGVGLFSLQNTAMLPTHWAQQYRDLRDYASIMEELDYRESNAIAVSLRLEDLS